MPDTKLTATGLNPLNITRIVSRVRRRAGAQNLGPCFLWLTRYLSLMTKFKAEHGKGGRPPKTELQAVRMNLAEFIGKNSHKMDLWLEEIYERDGPKAAMATLTNLMEFYVPKLARQEHTGADEGPVELSIKWSTDAK